MSDEEKILFRRLRSRDKSALAAIYERYRDDLLTVATYITGERQAGEDVLHDVFVRFAADIRRLGEPGSLRHFLVRCVANKAKDHLRRTTAAPVFADSDRLASAAAVDPGPSEKAAQTECRNDVMRAILCLPLEQREVVTLHLHGELTFSTIAGLLGASTNTVQSRYRYALQKLRTLLGAGVQP